MRSHLERQVLCLSQKARHPCLEGTRDRCSPTVKNSPQTRTERTVFPRKPQLSFVQAIQKGGMGSRPKPEFSSSQGPKHPSARAPVRGTGERRLLSLSLVFGANTPSTRQHAQNKPDSAKQARDSRPRASMKRTSTMFIPIDPRHEIVPGRFHA